MALQVSFKAIQTPDCATIKLEDDTPVYNAVTAPGGYGAPNATRADIKSTRFLWTLPDATVKTLDKGYLPDPALTQQSFVPGDLGLSEFADDCYNPIRYEVYHNDIASGSIVAGQTYRVLDPSSTNDAITYDGVAYTEGQTFLGVTGVTTYTEGSASLEVTELASFVENNVIYFCNIRTTIRNLMLAAATQKCQKGCNWARELNLLNQDLDNLLIAFANGMTDCACTDLKDLSQEAKEFFAKCCC